jgi:alanyl-tRNA synthetase
LIDEIDYRISVKNWKHLKVMYVQIKDLYDKLMINAHKQSCLGQIDKIKSFPPIFTKSNNYAIIQSHNIDNKTISQAISELVNSDKQHGYIIINQTTDKIQYFVSVSKELNLQKHLSANEVVKRVNEISNGKGGGLNTFAQGGTNDLEKATEIFKLLTQEF